MGQTSSQSISTPQTTIESSDITVLTSKINSPLDKATSSRFSAEAAKRKNDLPLCFLRDAELLTDHLNAIKFYTNMTSDTPSEGYLESMYFSGSIQQSTSVTSSSNPASQSLTATTTAQGVPLSNQSMQSVLTLENPLFSVVINQFCHGLDTFIAKYNICIAQHPTLHPLYNPSVTNGRTSSTNDLLDAYWQFFSKLFEICLTNDYWVLLLYFINNYQKFNNLYVPYYMLVSYLNNSALPSMLPQNISKSKGDSIPTMYTLSNFLNNFVNNSNFTFFAYNVMYRKNLTFHTGSHNNSIKLHHFYTARIKYMMKWYTHHIKQEIQHIYDKNFIHNIADLHDCLGLTYPSLLNNLLLPGPYSTSPSLLNISKKAQDKLFQSYKSQDFSKFYTSTLGEIIIHHISMNTNDITHPELKKGSPGSRIAIQSAFQLINNSLLYDAHRSQSPSQLKHPYAKRDALVDTYLYQFLHWNFFIFFANLLFNVQYDVILDAVNDKTLERVGLFQTIPFSYPELLHQQTTNAATLAAKKSTKNITSPENGSGNEGNFTNQKGENVVHPITMNNAQFSPIIYDNVRRYITLAMEQVGLHSSSGNPATQPVIYIDVLLHTIMLKRVFLSTSQGLDSLAKQLEDAKKAAEYYLTADKQSIVIHVPSPYSNIVLTSIDEVKILVWRSFCKEMPLFHWTDELSFSSSTSDVRKRKTYRSLVLDKFNLMFCNQNNSITSDPYPLPLFLLLKVVNSSYLISYASSLPQTQSYLYNLFYFLYQFLFSTFYHSTNQQITVIYDTNLPHISNPPPHQIPELPPYNLEFNEINKYTGIINEDDPYKAYEHSLKYASNAIDSSSNNHSNSTPTSLLLNSLQWPLQHYSPVQFWLMARTLRYNSFYFVVNLLTIAFFQPPEVIPHFRDVIMTSESLRSMKYSTSSRSSVTADFLPNQYLNNIRFLNTILALNTTLGLTPGYVGLDYELLLDNTANITEKYAPYQPHPTFSEKQSDVHQESARSLFLQESVSWTQEECNHRTYIGSFPLLNPYKRITMCNPYINYAENERKQQLDNDYKDLNQLSSTVVLLNNHYGGTYDLDASNLSPDVTEHQYNIEILKQMTKDQRKSNIFTNYLTFSSDHSLKAQQQQQATTSSQSALLLTGLSPTKNPIQEKQNDQNSRYIIVNNVLSYVDQVLFHFSASKQSSLPLALYPHNYHIFSQVLTNRTELLSLKTFFSSFYAQHLKFWSHLLSTGLFWASNFQISGVDIQLCDARREMASNWNNYVHSQANLYKNPSASSNKQAHIIELFKMYLTQHRAMLVLLPNYQQWWNIRRADLQKDREKQKENYHEAITNDSQIDLHLEYLNLIDQVIVFKNENDDGIRYKSIVQKPIKIHAPPSTNNEHLDNDNDEPINGDGDLIDLTDEEYHTLLSPVCTNTIKRNISKTPRSLVLFSKPQSNTKDSISSNPSLSMMQKLTLVNDAKLDKSPTVAVEPNKLRFVLQTYTQLISLHKARNYAKQYHELKLNPIVSYVPSTTFPQAICNMIQAYTAYFPPMLTNNFAPNLTTAIFLIANNALDSLKHIVSDYVSYYRSMNGSTANPLLSFNMFFRDNININNHLMVCREKQQLVAQPVYTSLSSPSKSPSSSTTSQPTYFRHPIASPLNRLQYACLWLCYGHILGADVYYNDYYSVLTYHKAVEHNSGRSDNQKKPLFQWEHIKYCLDYDLLCDSQQKIDPFEGLWDNYPKTDPSRLNIAITRENDAISHGLLYDINPFFVELLMLPYFPEAYFTEIDTLLDRGKASSSLTTKMFSKSITSLEYCYKHMLEMCQLTFEQFLIKTYNLQVENQVLLMYYQYNLDLYAQNQQNVENNTPDHTKHKVKFFHYLPDIIYNIEVSITSFAHDYHNNIIQTQIINKTNQFNLNLCDDYALSMRPPHEVLQYKQDHRRVLSEIAQHKEEHGENVDDLYIWPRIHENSQKINNFISTTTNGTAIMTSRSASAALQEDNSLEKLKRSLSQQSKPFNTGLLFFYLDSCIKPNIDDVLSLLQGCNLPHGSVYTPQFNIITDEMYERYNLQFIEALLYPHPNATSNKSSEVYDTNRMPSYDDIIYVPEPTSPQQNYSEDGEYGRDYIADDDAYVYGAEDQFETTDIPLIYPMTDTMLLPFEHVEYYNGVINQFESYYQQPAQSSNGSTKQNVTLRSTIGIESLIKAIQRQCSQNVLILLFDSILNAHTAHDINNEDQYDENGSTSQNSFINLLLTYQLFITRRYNIHQAHITTFMGNDEKGNFYREVATDFCDLRNVYTTLNLPTSISEAPKSPRVRQADDKNLKLNDNVDQQDDGEPQLFSHQHIPTYTVCLTFFDILDMCGVVHYAPEFVQHVFNTIKAFKQKLTTAQRQWYYDCMVLDTTKSMMAFEVFPYFNQYLHKKKSPLGNTPEAI